MSNGGFLLLHSDTAVKFLITTLKSFKSHPSRVHWSIFFNIKQIKECKQTKMASEQKTNKTLVVNKFHPDDGSDMVLISTAWRLLLDHTCYYTSDVPPLPSSVRFIETCSTFSLSWFINHAQVRSFTKPETQIQTAARLIKPGTTKKFFISICQQLKLGVHPPASRTTKASFRWCCWPVPRPGAFLFLHFQE